MTEDTSPENLRKFLESNDPAMVRMGISLAKGTGVEVTIKDLERFLKSKNVETIRTGIMLADEAGIGDEAMEMLCEPLVFPVHWQSREEDWEVRKSAAGTLGEIDDERAVEPLIKALEGVEGGIHGGNSAAAEALGKIGDARAVEPLIEVLKDSELRIAAVEALGEIGDARAVEPLIEALGDRLDAVRIAATEALRQIGDARAVDPLIELLGDEFWVVQPVLLALQRLGDAEVVESLIWALSIECEREVEWNYDHRFSDENRFIQDDIVHAIVQLGDKNNIEPLLQSIIDCYEDGSFDGVIEYLEYADENSRYSTTRGHSAPLEREYVGYTLNGLGWKPRTDEERIAYCAAMFQRSEFTDALLEWGAEAIDPLINILESGKTFASKALADLTKELVKTDKEKENILRFLESDDPAIVKTGASMLKGILKE